uniref:sarcosine dehydrogenase, mitochondrial-like n=1 Tax=Macaca mulatta TaxID=9544 RepID=UPI000732803E|nr:sarcosine dehydrogenase, mitochondrial-like [Macaca mulatta]
MKSRECDDLHVIEVACKAAVSLKSSCHLAVGRAVAQHNLSHITTVLQDQKFRCQLIDSSEDLSMVSIQGPASSAILQEGLDTHLSNEAFPFSTHKFLRASRHLVRATWLSFTGELGWGLHIPKVSCMPVYQAVMATGAKHDLVNAGHHAIDSLSIEKEFEDSGQRTTVVVGTLPCSRLHEQEEISL